MKKRRMLIFLGVLLVAVGTMVYVGQWRQRSAALYYSGTIEATQADLAFQVSGRVSQVLVDEGQAVVQNQVLVQLDPEEFLAARDQAHASLVLAQETLKELEALLALYQDTLPAEVERAQAAVKGLEWQRQEMESGFRDQEVAQARLAMQTASATMEEARKDKIRYEQLFLKKTVSEKDRDTVELRYETALKAYERAKEAHDLLKQGYRQESIQTARAKLAEGRAVLKQANANLRRIEATRRQVDAARAQVQAAAAALKLKEIQVRHTRLEAPFGGIISSCSIEPGEVVAPGREVISLADLKTVDLKIFVSETEIGKIKHGQTVTVKTDSFADKTYPGRIAFIAPEAEFTPKIIQTRQERVKLVYLVKITVANPHQELKPGMPADAWLH